MRELFTNAGFAVGSRAKTSWYDAYSAQGSCHERVALHPDENRELIMAEKTS